ncbi:MAG: hypothetical protein GY950_01050 [bacterium]|nr:hypothetical protein [bacterium]
METATVRIPRNKRDMLKEISSVEHRTLKDIFSEMIDEYIDRHKETRDLLSRPEWIENIRKGKQEVEEGVKGKSLHELED